MSTAVVAVAVTYAFVVLCLYLGQRRLIYPRRGVGAVPALPGATLEIIPSPAGTVHALFAAPVEREAPVIVHFHGNGEELADVVDVARLFSARGFGMLSVEYPGYGLSRHEEPSESTLYGAAEIALRHLIDGRGVERDRIVLFGQSLGSGVAVEMARRGYGGRLLLFSPYTSIADVADHYFPVVPNRLLVKDRFDNAEKAPSIDKPVLVVHGTDDEIIPFRLGKTLSERFPNARLFSVERGRHNDLFARGDDALEPVFAFCRGAG